MIPLQNPKTGLTPSISLTEVVESGDPMFAGNVLTMTQLPEDGDTITIGEVIYTIVDTLAGSAGQIKKVVGAPAGQFTSSSTANFSDGQIATIGSKTYTFQDTLTDVDGNVKIGVNRADTMDNWRNAINLGAGAGTNYAASMVEHPEVFALDDPGNNQLEIYAKVFGEAGNEITLTPETFPGRWFNFATTLENGEDPTIEAMLERIRNAIEAVNIETDWEGNAFDPSTTAHPLVSAEAFGATLTIQALTIGEVGNGIVCETTIVGASWENPTTEGGQD